ncbi:TPA: hypothetical protein ENG04_09510 [Candidatus Poribacteria bacterium]|nr:hypothetical protein [Candidatus Poribacteria bacterium]HEX30303.1 hypothetical protein [Candidatus Poribacteria bacterium]
MLPKVKLGEHEITRLIIGGNPFSGHSHVSGEMSRDMINYYTVDKIKETLRECERLGINTLLARGDNHIMRMLNEYRLEGGSIQWIAQTAPERASTRSNIRQIASYEPIAIYHHGGATDRLFKAGKLDEVNDHLKFIHDLGLTAGLGTHDPDVVRYAEEHGFELDFYMISFYNLTERGEVYLPEDREAACRVIREVDKTCLAFKIMAASRNDPVEAFRYAFENIKSKDAVVVGMFTKYKPDMIRQNVELTLKFAGGGG